MANFRSTKKNEETQLILLTVINTLGIGYALTSFLSHYYFYTICNLILFIRDLYTRNIFIYVFHYLQGGLLPS